MATWTEIADQTAYNRACAFARGAYQRALLDGTEALSGSTLKGRARQYGGRYAASRKALLARLRSAGVPVSERRGAHGKRILVLG